MRLLQIDENLFVITDYDGIEKTRGTEDYCRGYANGKNEEFQRGEVDAEDWTLSE